MVASRTEDAEGRNKAMFALVASSALESITNIAGLFVKVKTNQGNMSMADAQSKGLSFILSNYTSGTIIEKTVRLIVTIAQWGGILLSAGAVIMLLMAVRNEDSDGKFRATLALTAGAALAGVGQIVKQFLSY